MSLDNVFSMRVAQIEQKDQMALVHLELGNVRLVSQIAMSALAWLLLSPKQSVWACVSRCQVEKAFSAEFHG